MMGSTTDGDMNGGWFLGRRHFVALGVGAGTGAVSGATAWAQAAPTVATDGKRKAPARIVVLGDSLSAEYGLRRGTGWVALLEKKLEQEAIAATVINASVSGDTTAGGRARLTPLLAQHHPTVLVIELGGNDALRGLPLQATQDNLAQMTRQAQRAGARVLLVGMQVPPNYGASYASRFADLFAQVARANQAALVPFLLKGVADGDDPLRLFQSDRIHPTAEAHPIILNNIWPALRKLLP